MKTKKITRVISGYAKKPQLHGKFKVVEYSILSNGTFPKKRTLFKDRTTDEADELIYKLERK